MTPPRRAPDLDGQVIVVTGGSRGIGRALVLEALARGAAVVFGARRLAAEAGEVLAEARALSAGHRVAALAADVTDEADVDRLFEAATERFGGVDVAVANAGVHRAGLLVSLAAADWQAMLDTNLTGAFLVARRAVAEFLRQGRGGRFVAVGSVMMHGAASDAGYAAGKGGLAGLVAAFAEHYGPEGITANLLVAGLADTAMTRHLDEGQRERLCAATPLRRIAAPEEVARAVLFLATPGAAALNGQLLHVSGGLREPPALA